MFLVISNFCPAHIPAGDGSGDTLLLQLKDNGEISSFRCRSKNRIVPLFCPFEKTGVGLGSLIGVRFGIPPRPVLTKQSPGCLIRYPQYVQIERGGGVTSSFVTLATEIRGEGVKGTGDPHCLLPAIAGALANELSTVKQAGWAKLMPHLIAGIALLF